MNEKPARQVDHVLSSMVTLVAVHYTRLSARRDGRSRPLSTGLASASHPTTRSRHHLQSMNVRSLSTLKLDALLVEQRGRSLDVMLLCETLHDAESVLIHCLRSDGFGVIERARPRSCQAEASPGINHGEVAIVATIGIRLKDIDIDILPTTFECVACPHRVWSVYLHRCCALPHRSH